MVAPYLKLGHYDLDCARLNNALFLLGLQGTVEVKV
jgi:hypothetical protein